MTEAKLLLGRFAMLCSDMVLLSLAWFLFFGSKNALPGLPYLLWGGCAALSLLVNTRLKQKGGRVDGTMLLTAALSALTGALLVRLSWGAELSLLCRGFVFFMGAAVVLHAALLVHDVWQYNQQVLYLDSMVVCAALLLLVRSGENWERVQPCLVWAILSAALGVLTLAAYRTQKAGRSVLWLTAGSALLGVLAWLAGERLHGAALRIAAGAQGLGRLLGRVLSLIGRGLGAVLRWLLGLFPSDGGPAPFLEPPESTPDFSEVLPETDGTGSALLIAAAVVIAVLALAWLLRAVRGKRWKGGRHDSARLARPERRRVRGRRLFDWSAVWKSLVFFLRSLRCRNRPEGLLTCAERAFRKTPLQRRTGESAPGFLRRLRAEGKECYGELADCLERLYYKGEPKNLPPVFPREFRRQVRRDKKTA